MVCVGEKKMREKEKLCLEKSSEMLKGGQSVEENLARN